MGQAFPRSLRLLRPREFREVFDRGRSRSDARLIVYALPREEGAPGRLGLVVGRRFGPAHLRNTWKRRVREAFRRERRSLPPGHDLVVLPAGKGQAPEYEGIRASLLQVAGAAARAFAERGPRRPGRRK